MIAREQAIVFRGGKRRYFTLRAACYAEARTKYLVKHPCECESGDNFVGYPGYSCDYHSGHPRDKAIVERLARFYLRQFKRDPAAAREGE